MRCEASADLCESPARDHVDLHSFLAEAVYDLRTTLRSKNSDLLVRFGKMEKVVDQVVEALKANGDQVKSVLLQKEVSGLLSRTPDCGVIT